MWKKNIAILAGGDSSEYEISLKTAEQIKKTLDKERYNSHIVLMKGKDWHLQNEQFQNVQINKDDFSLRVNNYSKTVFDCVFLAIHGTPAEDGKLPAYFDLINIPYISCGVFASTISFNKFQCNKYLNGLGFLTPRSIFFKDTDVIRPKYIIEQIGLPCFVKPNAGGSSIGITKVKRIDELEEAIITALKESPEIIIEEYIEGMELTAGIIKTKKQELVLPLTEVVHKREFYDYNAKYDTGFTEIYTPARITETIDAECKRISSLIYEALNCRGIVRLDFIVRKNKIYFLEINTIPDLSENSIIARQCQVMEIELPTIYTELIEQAIEEKKAKGLIKNRI